MFGLKQLLFFGICSSLITWAKTDISCPSDWTEYDGKCLIVVPMRNNFSEANQTCSTRNGVLASFRSEAEAKSLFDQIHYKKLFYIGTWFRLNEQNDGLVNLDGSPVKWLNIKSKDNVEGVPKQLGACIVARANWNPETGLQVENFPIPCESMVDGFVCQLKSEFLNKDNIETSKPSEDIQNEQTLENLDKLVSPSNAISHTLNPLIYPFICITALITTLFK